MFVFVSVQVKARGWYYCCLLSHFKVFLRIGSLLNLELIGLARLTGHQASEILMTGLTQDWYKGAYWKTWHFHKGAAVQIQVIKSMWQAFYQLSYLLILIPDMFNLGGKSSLMLVKYPPLVSETLALIEDHHERTELKSCYSCFSEMILLPNCHLVLSGDTLDHNSVEELSVALVGGDQIWFSMSLCGKKLSVPKMFTVSPLRTSN